MTPEERRLVDRLFERLATLESAPRDPDAVASINRGLEHAPNALYPLVQTVLLQEEALKRADERIRALESERGVAEPEGQGGFLDSMRDSLFGRRSTQGSVPQGSVPNVRREDSAWSAPQDMPAARRPMGLPPGLSGRPQPDAPTAQQPAAASGGGSFLGTAAATAAGVLGGALLMNSLGGLFGGGQAKAQTALDQPGGGSTSPWDNKGGGDLSREAGLNDIGGSGERRAAYEDGGGERQGLFDTASYEAQDEDYDHGGDDFGIDSDFV